MMAAGTLVPGAIEEVPLSAAASAHGRLEAGTLHGVKVVLRP